MRQRLLFLAILIGLAGGQLAHAATSTALLRVQEGTAALLRGQFEQAVQSFDRALTEGDLSKERTASIYSDRGVAKWRLHRYDDALADLNKDGTSDAVDVQLVIDAAMGLDAGDIDADVYADSAVDSLDIQVVVNGVLGV